MRLKHVLNRAVAWGCLKDNPARYVKKAKEAPGRVRYLTTEERDILLNGADVTVATNDGRMWRTHREPKPSLRLYIIAALQTGARRSELIELRWSDVDMKNMTIAFGRTKNGERRVVPMTSTLHTAIAALFRPADAKAYVFPRYEPQVLSRSFARFVHSIGIRDFRFHDLRHDAASTLTMAGVSQRTVMEILGHKDPRVTARYQHLAPGHLRDAMRALNDAVTRPLPTKDKDGR